MVATRAFNTGDSSDDIISWSSNSIKLYTASSSSGSLRMAFHGKSEGKQTVYFQLSQITATPTTTTSTTTTTAKPTTSTTSTSTTTTSTTSTTAAPAPTTTTSATQAAQSVKIVSSTTIGPVTIAMAKYQTAQILEVEMYGPIGSWFGVAFGSHFGGDALCWTTGTSGQDTAGEYPDWSVDGESTSDIYADAVQNWNVIDYSQVNGKQRMIATRAFNTGDSSDDIISWSSNSMKLYTASSSSGSLRMAFHGKSEGKQTVYFQLSQITAAPTTSTTSTSTSSTSTTTVTAPTTTTTTTAPVQLVKLVPSTTIGDVTVAMTKYQSAQVLKVEMYGPIGSWFGIAFGSHFGADSLCWTTGTSGQDTAGEYPDWSVDGESTSDIYADAVQNWNVVEYSQVNGEQRLVARRLFNTGDASDDIISWSTDSMKLLTASSSSGSLRMAFHGDNKWKQTVYFQLEQITTAAPAPTTSTTSTTTTSTTSVPSVNPTTSAPTAAPPTMPPGVTVKTFPKTTFGGSVAVAITKYQTTQLLEVEMYGAIGSWFGVAFDSHFSGDSLLYTTGSTGQYTAGEYPDWNVNGMSDTDVIADAVQNWNVTDNTQVNGQQKIVATRALNTGDAADGIIDFASNSMTILVASSDSNSLQMAYHGAYRWQESIAFQAGADATAEPTTKPTTIAPSTARPTIYIPPDATTKTFPKTEISGLGIFIGMTMNKTNEIFEVELYGPIGKWFGVVFGTHYDGDALVYSTGYDGTEAAGEAPYYRVDGKSTNTVTKEAQQDWNVVEIKQVDGLQKIVVQRALDAAVDFNMNTMDVLVTYSESDTLQFGYHGASFSGSATIDFEAGVSVTTTTSTTSVPVHPTHNIGQNVSVKVFPFEEVGYDSGIFVGIHMYQETRMFEVELRGPMNRWFGVAFGTHFAGGALLYTTNYHGRDIAGEVADYALKGLTEVDVIHDTQQDWNVTELSTIDGQQHIVAHRALDTGDTEHDYIIDYTANTIDILVAHAESETLQFAYHGSYRWSTTLDFEAGTASEDDTPITTDEGDDDDDDEDEQVDEKVFSLTEIEDSGIFIAANMRKSTDTYTLTLHGPSNKWFGVVWNDHYAGDAFIWLKDDEPDYKCSGKETKHIVKDTIQSWTVLENIEEDGLTKIVASRALDTKDHEHDYAFDFDEKKQTVLLCTSVDDSFDFDYHGVYRWTTILDFETGELIQMSSDQDVFTTLNHAIFMLIGFGILIPCAIIFMRFKLVLKQWIASFWIATIGQSCLVIGTVSVFVGFVEKLSFVTTHDTNVYSYHSYGGFGVFGIWMLFMIMYGICTKCKRAKPASFFKAIVALCFIFMGFGQIISGILHEGMSIMTVVAFVIYAAAYMLVYVFMEISLSRYSKSRKGFENSEMMLMDMVQRNNYHQKDIRRIHVND